MAERKMATIRMIDSIDPIEGADAIEVATVGGWKVVVKKGEFSPNDVAIFLEIDSWVPHELAPFLSKGKEPREYNGVKGEKLRTIRLKKQLSQGLLLPMSIFGCGSGYDEPVDLRPDYKVGDDVSEVLGIQKWEAPINAQLAGVARGNFPSVVPKTDQERCQNLKKELQTWIEKGYTWEVTEKLDGSSCTIYLDLDGEFHVCSRNLDLVRDENNSFWKAAINYNVEAVMRDNQLTGLAIQGELIGEGIQGNPYGIKGHRFCVFDIYDTQIGAYLSRSARHNVANLCYLDSVPVLNRSVKLTETESIDSLLKMAEGISVMGTTNTEREGLVFACNEHPGLSFKAISNNFLLGQK